MPPVVLPCARGTEALLADELTTLGVTDVEPGRSQVSGTADYATALRCCLWSRIASRVLWAVTDVEAPDADALYHALSEVPFEDHLAAGRTFAVDCTLGLEPGAITHSQYAALRTKDAIVDRLRSLRGDRPDVDRDRPDVQFHLHVARGRASLAIDLAGDSLNRRGYRGDGRGAPLKENLAAALLVQMGWPARAAAGEPFVDPMCGSGTLLVEAAYIATDRAPGLLRQHWGFSGWSGHDAAVWTTLVDEARERAKVGMRTLTEVRFFGRDEDGAAIEVARRTSEIAGFTGRIAFERASIDDLVPPVSTPGLLVTNPPYGERLGDPAELPGLYRRFGDLLKRNFPGWTAGVFTAHGPLTSAIGLRPARRDIFWNGPIECRLLTIPISSEAPRSDDGPGYRKASAASAMFANRLQKNLKHLGKWARREGVSAYRIYDADLPEYAVAVDLYEGHVEGETQQRRFAYVQEYAAPSTVDPGKAERRLRDLLARIPEVLDIPPEQVELKVRRKQKPTTQYEAQRTRSDRIVIVEGGRKLLVNIRDYLDTGLFLDQRQLRSLIAASSKGRDVLNLFCYTASASVYAATAGARSTTSVDLSNTYLAWAEDNFVLNELDPKTNRLVQDDCVNWLAMAAASTQRYGVIVLAPPTFSNSKRMESTIEVQRDHRAMLEACEKLLAPDGVIWFVNHFRRFKLDAPDTLVVEETTKKTLPPDFARDQRFHHTFKLTRR